MPVIEGWGWLIPGLGIFLESALSVMLLRGRHMHAWPALSSFVFARTLWGWALLAIYGSYHAIGCEGDGYPAAYFWLYWLGAAVLAVLEAGIVLELACAVAPAARRILHVVIPAVIAVCLLIAALVSDYRLHFALSVTRTVVDLNRIIALAWLMASLFFPYSALVLGWRFRRRQLFVSMGFTVMLIGECIMSILLAIYPLKWQAVSSYGSILYLLALIAWGVAFLCDEPLENRSPHLAALSRDLAALLSKLNQERAHQ